MRNFKPFPTLERHIPEVRMGDMWLVSPRKTLPVMLGKSRTVALRRYLANERTLKGKKQWESFHGGVQEYLDLHHAERVPDSDMNKQEGVYYLPMHGVIKEESTTTKLQIVFDASARTSSGQSDTLLSGPSLYPS